MILNLIPFFGIYSIFWNLFHFQDCQIFLSKFIPQKSKKKMAKKIYLSILKMLKLKKIHHILEQKKMTNFGTFVHF